MIRGVTEVRTNLCTLAALAAFSVPATATELAVVGTGDGIDVLRAIGAAYATEKPRLTIVVPPSIGSGGGLAAVGSEREVLARVARPLSENERALGLVETPVFRLPSAFFVHASVGLTSITSEQLAAIYSGRLTNWREIGGADLRVKVVRREDNDSTLLVLRQSMPGWKELALTDKSKMATTTQEAISTVKAVEGSIGFGPYTRSLEPEVTVLKIDGRFPTDEGYPSAVTVSFVHKQTTVTQDAKEFIAYARSEKARRLLASMGGVPVTR